MTEAKDPRVIMVGSVTGNDNTVGGGGVYPIADLKNLDGFRAGFKNPIAMADGYGFIGAKAYKDSKLCLMMLSNMLHARYHKRTGIAFSSIYPGCIAESPLFREKRAWFRKYFPVFMKYITGGFVGEEEAGQRLFQVAHDPRCAKSGVYWSWNGGPREHRGLEALEKGGQISGGGGAGGGWDSIYENDQSDKVNDVDLSVKLFQYSTEITGAKWPAAKTVVSPCPTLKVIGTISKQMIEREELKRMAEHPGLNEDGTPIKPKLTTAKKTKLVADKVVGGLLSRTVGRVAGFANRRLLGKLPEEALTGSFHEEKPLAKATSVVSITTPEGGFNVVDQWTLIDGHSTASVANGSNGATAPASNGANGSAVPVANGANGATIPVANGANGETSPKASAEDDQVFKSSVDKADREFLEDTISVQVFNKDKSEQETEKKTAAQATA